LFDFLKGVNKKNFQTKKYFYVAQPQKNINCYLLYQGDGFYKLHN